MGVSGGRRALKGPAMMPGGDVVRLGAPAPRAGAGLRPERQRLRVDHCGRGGAGHFVEDGPTTASSTATCSSSPRRTRLLRHGLGQTPGQAARHLRAVERGPAAELSYRDHGGNRRRC
ncbi:MAG: hypothetical protein R3F43_10185 [bacterium]